MIIYIYKVTRMNINMITDANYSLKYGETVDISA